MTPESRLRELHRLSGRVTLRVYNARNGGRFYALKVSVGSSPLPRITAYGRTADEAVDNAWWRLCAW